MIAKGTVLRQGQLCGNFIFGAVVDSNLMWITFCLARWNGRPIIAGYELDGEDFVEAPEQLTILDIDNITCLCIMTILLLLLCSFRPEASDCHCQLMHSVTFAHSVQSARALMTSPFCAVDTHHPAALAPFSFFPRCRSVMISWLCITRRLAFELCA